MEFKVESISAYKLDTRNVTPQPSHRLPHPPDFNVGPTPVPFDDLGFHFCFHLAAPHGGRATLESGGAGVASTERRTET